MKNTFKTKFIHILWITFMYLTTPIRSLKKCVQISTKYINRTPSFQKLMGHIYPIAQRIRSISSLTFSMSLSSLQSQYIDTNIEPIITFKPTHESNPEKFNPKPLHIDKTHTIHNNQNGKIYKTPLELDYYQQLYPFVKNKKIIAVSPGGYKGFYTMGVVAYIKENYDLSDYIFTGASAGSWNSLFFCLRPPELPKKESQNLDNSLLQIMNLEINEDLENTFTTNINHNIDIDNKRIPSKLIKNLLTEDVKQAKDVQEMEQILKKNLLNHYKKEDFDLERLYIGVTQITQPIKGETIIYSNFESLEDAIDCCIASSHIPLVTGNFKHIYRNHYCYDGGFLRNPYLYLKKNPDLHITPSMWKKPRPANLINILKDISEMTTLFSRDKYDFMTLYNQGYNDSKEHKEFLDRIFGSSLDADNK